MINSAYKIADLQTEQQVRFIKDSFSSALQQALELHPVSSPLYVEHASGLNDDLNGTELPVRFKLSHTDEEFAIVHSLAKWKRLRVKELNLPVHQGIITNMIAIRPGEVLSDIHSCLVDQWDWEMVIDMEDRNLAFLTDTVSKIYGAIYETAAAVNLSTSGAPMMLPEKIHFIHSEELLEKYPNLDPKSREMEAAKEFGAMFIIGIGGLLVNGEPHDGRAPDYDDWSSPTEGLYRGLNGDILLWDSYHSRALEVSSMGIRVDPTSLLHQLQVSKAEHRKEYGFHQQLLSGTLPLTIGGGIGQSRLCMFLLQKPNIGMVQYCYS